MNLLIPLSFHVFLPDILQPFFNPPRTKTNIYERDWSKVDQEKFILDSFSIDWDQTLGIDKSDVGKSFKSFLERFNSFQDLHAPYKKISNKI